MGGLRGFGVAGLRGKGGSSLRACEATLMEAQRNLAESTCLHALVVQEPSPPRTGAAPHRRLPALRPPTFSTHRSGTVYGNPLRHNPRYPIQNS